MDTAVTIALSHNDTSIVTVGVGEGGTQTQILSPTDLLVVKEKQILEHTVAAAYICCSRARLRAVML